jgi:hypothetical protein
MRCAYVALMLVTSMLAAEAPSVVSNTLPADFLNSAAVTMSPVAQPVAHVPVNSSSP